MDILLLFYSYIKSFIFDFTKGKKKKTPIGLIFVKSWEMLQNFGYGSGSNKITICQSKCVCVCLKKCNAITGKNT